MTQNGPRTSLVKPGVVCVAPVDMSNEQSEDGESDDDGIRRAERNVDDDEQQTLRVRRVNSQRRLSRLCTPVTPRPCPVKAKFHYTSWFRPSSELAPNMFGANSELASVMEFGREPASSC